jgi:hypothetical protein
MLVLKHLIMLKYNGNLPSSDNTAMLGFFYVHQEWIYKTFNLFSHIMIQNRYNQPGINQLISLWTYLRQHTLILIFFSEKTLGKFTNNVNSFFKSLFITEWKKKQYTVVISNNIDSRSSSYFEHSHKKCNSSSITFEEHFVHTLLCRGTHDLP